MKMDWLIIPILLLAAAASILIYPIAYELIPAISNYAVEKMMEFMRKYKNTIWKSF